MKEFLKKFLALILPILAVTSKQFAMEVVETALYPDRTIRRRPRPYGMRDRLAIYDQIGTPRRIPRQRTMADGYSGIVEVAFRVSGPNQTLVEEWIAARLPKPENDEMMNVNLVGVHIVRDEKGDDE